LLPALLLKPIDKSRYRKHLNLTIGASILTLLISSLGLSATFIAVISQPGGDNFMLNLMAVIISLAMIITVLTTCKHRRFFNEIYYVWQLKMELNFINAKLHNIEASAKHATPMAVMILAFYYQGSRQLWTLDDNMISIESLDLKQEKLAATIASGQLTINVDEYKRILLKQF